MTKKEFEDLVTDYCHELYHDMSPEQLRNYVINIMYQEKVLQWPDHSIAEVRKKYPQLLEKYDRQSV